MVQINDPYLRRVAQIESGMNPIARNPNSSAKGLFQFIDSTAKEYGLNNPFDPNASLIAAQKLTENNRNALRQALGREPTNAELYLAHQQGATGAIKLLSNPNNNVTDTVGNDAATLNSGSPDMTSGEFVQNWDDKFNEGQEEFIEVETPDGIVEFPSSMSDQEIEAALQKLFPVTQQKTVDKTEVKTPNKPQSDGFLARVGKDFQRHKQNVQKTKGTVDPMVLGQYAIGEGIGFVSDVATEPIVSGFRALPDFIETPIRETGSFVAEKAAPYVAPAVKKYGNWKSGNPNKAALLETGVNYLQLLGLGKGEQVTAKGLYKAGDKVLDAAQTQRLGKVQELITPEMRGTVTNQAVSLGSRTKQMGGINAPQKIIPTLKEKEIAETVSKISGIDKVTTIRGKQNLLQEYNKIHAENLEKQVRKNNVPIFSKSVDKAITSKINQMKELDYISGDVETYASNIRDKALKLFSAEKDPTAAGLFTVRKKLDNWVRNQDSKLLDTDPFKKPKADAALQIRMALNDLVAERVPDVKFKQGLREEHNIYEAIRNIVPKANAEAATRLGRALEKAGNLVSVKSALAASAGLGGAAALGVASAIPPIVLTGGVLYLAGKALGSVQAKKLLGNILKTSGKILGAEDRLAIQEAMSMAKDPLPSQLLLAPPDKMSRLPLTEKEIAISKAKINRGK